MADLQLNIKGDSTEAVDAFKDTGKAAEKSGEAAEKALKRTKEEAKATKEVLKDMAKAFAAVAAAAAAYTVAAVKAWSDGERVQRQLARATGDYAKELGEQADAMGRVYAVDGDVIKQSQTLLAQWGGVGAATKETTKAILDYAAATGQDAIAATNDLIKQVETGGAGLKKLGVDFTATGDRGKDLAAAVDGIAKKFGGAAAADSAGLNGQAERAKQAFEDLTKAWGGMVGSFVEKSGVLDTVATKLREITSSVFTPEGEKKAQTREFWLEQKRIYEEGLSGRLTLYKDFANGVTMTWEEMQTELAKIETQLRPDWQDALTRDGKRGKATGTTAAAEGIAAKAQAEMLKELSDQKQKAWRDDLKAEEMHELEQADKKRDAFAKDLDFEAGRVKEALKKRKELLDGYDAIRVEEEKRAAASAERMAQEEIKAQEEAAKKLADLQKSKEQQARQSADAIGAAFVNGLTAQLSKLAEGEELDPAMFVGEILAATVSAAAAIIGSVYGMPALGAAVGNLAAMGIRAGASGISAQAKKGGRRSYHTGGWVGDEAELPRYHSGAWIRPDEQMAVLQQGERVLSRAEVTAMGGPRGVDGAAGGSRPGFVVNVSALDAKSAAESFVSGVDRGLRDALRTGQGFLPQLLPQGVR